MKIFSAAQLKAWDQDTIQHAPVTSIDLMERAALAFTEHLLEDYPKESFLIFCGTGNNGGDGLAVARLLLERKYSVEVILLQDRNLSPDTQINYQRWLDKGGKVRVVDTAEEITAIPWSTLYANYSVFIDALLGTGLNRPAENNYASLIHKINEAKTQVVAVDIPSGLSADVLAKENDVVVKASQTITFQIPKRSFFYAEHYRYTGKWSIAAIELRKTYEEQTSTAVYYTQLDTISSIYTPRSPFAHKGNFGRALLVAGSYGMMGAAVMASRACLRAGVGLLKVYSPSCGLSVLQIAVPEAMVLTDASDKEFTQAPNTTGYQAIGLGPGWHESAQALKVLKDLLASSTVPLVIDAGALNMLSKDMKLLAKIPAGSILTPHKKEFDRLAGRELSQPEQEALAITWAKQHNIQFVLKGKYSAVVLSDGTIHYNSTGNPGMAKGGSGDCLTGILLALLAQGYTSKDAALFGTFLHGYAGDEAAKIHSEEAMLPSDLIECIGILFKEMSA